MRGLSFWLSEPVVELVGYMVSRRLAGLPVEFVRDYFVDYASPSTIARKYGIGKHAVRGVLIRCGRFMRFAEVAYVVKVSMPFVLKVRPMLRGDAVVTCVLCGDSFVNHADRRVFHMRRKHSEVWVDAVTHVFEDVLTHLGLRDGIDLHARVKNVLVGRKFKW